jgi:hypothetical protein
MAPLEAAPSVGTGVGVIEASSCFLEHAASVEAVNIATKPNVIIVLVDFCKNFFLINPPIIKMLKVKHKIEHVLERVIKYVC